MYMYMYCDKCCDRGETTHHLSAGLTETASLHPPTPWGAFAPSPAGPPETPGIPFRSLGASQHVCIALHGTAWHGMEYV